MSPRDRVPAPGTLQGRLGSPPGVTGTVKHQTSDQAPSLPGRELHWGLGVGSPLPHGAGGPRAAGPAPLGRGPRPHTAPAEAEAASRLHGFSNTHPASCLSSSITLRSHRSSLHAGRGRRQLGARTVAPVAWRPAAARRGPSWHQSPVRSTRPPAPSPGATRPEPQAETGSTAGHGGLGHMGGGLRVWARRPHSEGASVPWGGSAGARPASVVSVQRGEPVPVRGPRKED